MTINTEPIRDRRGVPMFVCPRCGVGLAPSDLFDLGLRVPEPYETREDYLDAELLDAISHAACSAAAKAS
jgi:hypothetical protein